VDTSVLLATLLAEDRCPPAHWWNQSLISSRLLEYEVWNRIHARGLARSHGEATNSLLGRVAFLELVPPVLERALEPFPMAVRTLDALHLSSIRFLRQTIPSLAVATYDRKMTDACRHLRFPVAAP